MSIKEIAILIFLSVLLMAPSIAQGETFKSLKYGFSIEYPTELEVSVINSNDAPVKFYAPNSLGSLTIVAMSDSGLSLEDTATKIESELKSSTQLEVLNSSNIMVGGKEALAKEYLLKAQTSSNKAKLIYLKGNNRIYILTFLVAESNYDRADSLYFENLIQSFKVFPVDTATEKNIDGFPKVTSDRIWSSPVLGDINKDGTQELIVGSNDGKLYVWTKDGKALKGFPVEAKDYIRSSPALADLEGDGRQDIIVGSDDGKLYAWNSNGSILAGFPKLTAGPITSSPAIGDIDKDGKPEIIVGSRDRGIYAWRNDGSLVCGFPLITGYDVWSSPALADLNGDGKLDVVIGSKKEDKELETSIYSSYGAVFSLFTGQVYALNDKGSLISGFPASLKMPSLHDLIDSAIGYSSPAIGDIDGDGKPEIIIGAGHELDVLKSNGEELRGFPVEAGGSLTDSFIALGDLNNDKNIEIVAGASDGRLYIWKSDGSAYPGFPIQSGGYLKQITLGDINGDGKQEILAGSSDNRVHAWNLDGAEVAGFPKVTAGAVETAPTLGDLNGDGSLELIVGSSDGSLYAWKISGKYGKLDWPMVRQNPQHTGTFAPK